MDPEVRVVSEMRWCFRLWGFSVCGGEAVGRKVALLRYNIMAVQEVLSSGGRVDMSK